MSISANTLRVVVLLTSVAVVLVLLLATQVAASAGADTASAEVAMVASVSTYTVIAGDTLWDIATDHTAPGGDIRRTVFDIQQHNGIDSVIVPGQVLEIPGFSS